MAGTHDLALFALTVLVLNATPGVDMLLTLTATWGAGLRAGLAAAAGICAGCALHALAATFGLAAVLAASATAFTALKWAGAAYLLWLAWGLARSSWRGDARQTGSDGLGDPPHRSAAAWFRQGLLTNVLNPKVALFFLALLPQFIAEGAPDKTLAFAALGAWAVAQSTLFLFAFVLLVAPLRRLRPRPAVTRTLQASGAALFAGLALRLAWAPRS